MGREERGQEGRLARPGWSADDQWLDADLRSVVDHLDERSEQHTRGITSGLMDWVDDIARLILYVGKGIGPERALRLLGLFRAT